MTKCRGCGAKIEFIKLTTGKSIPVNPSPIYVENKTGKDVIITTDGRVTSGVLYTGADGTMLTKGYISHFATCPMAGMFRRRKS